jgi:hypothetical protein
MVMTNSPQNVSSPKLLFSDLRPGGVPLNFRNLHSSCGGLFYLTVMAIWIETFQHGE